jgi:hypothetical protein
VLDDGFNDARRLCDAGLKCCSELGCRARLIGLARRRYPSRLCYRAAPCKCLRIPLLTRTRKLALNRLKKRDASSEKRHPIG